MGVFCHCCKFFKLCVCDHLIEFSDENAEDGGGEYGSSYLAFQCTCDQVDPNGFDGFDFFNMFDCDNEKACKFFESNGTVFFFGSQGYSFPTEDKPE